MEYKLKVDSPDVIMEPLLALLDEAEAVPLVISGNSMTPFLVDGRDTVYLSKPNRPLKKGDMVLLILCLIVAGFGCVCIASATSADKFGTNIRYIDKELITEPLGFFSVDVSFISLKPVLPVAYDLLEEGGCGVCLIKPQFEAGREKVGKKGVVREKSTHIEVIENVLAFTKEIGFSVKGLDFSPIKGPEGNIEYLMYIKKDVSESEEFDVEALVEKSHELNIK